MSSGYPLRQRNLTPAAGDIFQDNVTIFRHNLATLENDIRKLISALYDSRSEDKEAIVGYINQNFSNYENINSQYVDFLVRSRTRDGEELRLAQLQSYDNVKEAVMRALNNQTDNQPGSDHECDTQSQRSRSSSSSTRSTLLRKRAQLEATKTKTKYAQQQTELLKQKLALEAELKLIEIKKEAETLETEIRVMESETFQDDNESVASVRVQRTQEYVQSFSVTQSDRPQMLQSYSLNVNAPNFTSSHPVTCTSQSRPLTTVGYPIRTGQSTPAPVTTSTSNLPNPTASYPTRPNIQSQIPQGQPSASSVTDICELMTKMIARKDVVLSRLVKYSDSPIQYLSWKQTFKDVMKELSVSSSEELDLLIKWLGPDSSRQAESMKTACAGNHVDALRKVWDRLDIRYGSPELIEACLRNKVTNFPKLTNSAADCKRLYDLYDILSEIQCVKANPLYASVLALYDSSSGVNQIVSRLPSNLQEKWSSTANNYKTQHGMLFPPFSVFVSFIYDMAKWKTDPSFQFSSSTPTNKAATQNQPQYRVTARKTDLSEDKPTCPIHNTKHDLNQCRAFRMKPIKERYEILKKFRLCFRCCSLKRHTKDKCREVVKCELCKKSDHPTALHISPDLDSSKSSQDKNVSTLEGDKVHGREHQPALPSLTSSCTQICGDANCYSKSCAKILQVFVFHKDKPEQARKVYALIDDQSNQTLGSPELFDSLGENPESVSFTLSTCTGKSVTTGRKGTDYIVQSTDGSVQLAIPNIIECSAIPNNRHEIPSPEVVRNFPHLHDLAPFIPPIDSEVHIELLIGRDIIQAHHVLEQRLSGDASPYAHRLPLGWVIVGESCIGKTHRNDTIIVNKTQVLPSGRATCLIPCSSVIDIKEHNIFEKTAQDEKLGPSVEDRLFIELMNAKVKKDTHWFAPLPFRQNRETLPNNRAQVVQRMESLDRSLRRDIVKKEHFTKFMQTMIENKHAEIAPPLKTGTECWYLPIFGVYNPKKPTKIRIVFDASAKFNGVSLNDVLMQGPDLTNNLLGVLLRFRKESVAVMSDIEQMFYNFRVPEEDRDFLRFVWHDKNDISQPLIDYRMAVHIFGNSSSPSVATFCLRKSVEDASPDVIDFVHNNFYVDDGLVSCIDSESAIDLLKRTRQALETGGHLRLHKIMSNSLSVLQSFPTEDLATDLKDLDLGSSDTPTVRSLGILWNTSSDQFVFRVNAESKPFTRRGALSVINSLFDPIGFASPITMYGKLLLREMMSESVRPINWDDDLPDHLRSKWENWVKSLVSLQDIYIPRKYSSISFAQARKREVHIFSDASKDAIASVAYLKLEQDGKSDVCFLMSKAKVAPVHGHTIPRLELCAAVLSIEIADLVKEHLMIDSSDFYYYTDSQVVLGYLSNETRRFYVYVSNRVNRIRSASSPNQWYYISTDNNPADVATRRISASDLQGSKFLSGPDTLQDDCSSDVSAGNYELVSPDQDKELYPEVNVRKIVVHDKVIDWSSKIEKFSTWNSLIRAITVLKTRIRKLHGESIPTRDEVERFVLKCIQNEVFESDIESIKHEGQLSRSNLLPLSPILDSFGILRVGGRLSKQSDINLNDSHPIIIPKDHHVGLLLVRHFHNQCRHQGRHLTEGALRSAGFWVIGSKRLVSSLIRNCVICKKMRGKFCFQQMSDLPQDRISSGPPFTFVGVDTFGPWPIIQRKTRGLNTTQKRWAILFTCLLSRAIHIEVVSDLSSESFINAFRRFIAIRGPVKIMRSDRGTNFVGAIHDLGFDTEYAESGPVGRMLTTHGTTWKFNPPNASHFGGTWERMIGISRRILDNMLIETRHSLTHDVLVTLMAEVMAIVNSRPLVQVSTDPQDPQVLSPALLLTQKQRLDSHSLPEFNNKEMLKSQWKLVQGLADQFWTKWRKEYLHTLQLRNKWQVSTDNVKAGDIVIMRDKELCRSEWPMAIVTQVFPSDDSKVRKVEVRILRGDKQCTYIRPIVELIPLVGVSD